MQKFRIPVLFLLVSSTFLAACDGNYARTSARNDSVGERVDASLSRFGERGAIRAGGAQMSSGVFVAARADRANASALLPSRLEGPSAVQLESRDAMTLTEIASRLTEITGMPHLAALGPTGAVVNNTDVVQSASELESLIIGGNGRPGSIPPRSTLVTGSENSSLKLRPNLRGPLSAVLNEVAATFQVEWSYQDGRVLFQDYVTRQYSVMAPPGTSSMTSSVGAENMTSSASSNSDVWAELTEGLKGLIGKSSTINVGSSTGTITVTAPVSDQNRVASYIQKMNASIGQQITFDVTVLNVTNTERETAGLELSGLFQSGARSAGRVSGSADIGAMNIGVIDGNFSINAVVNALSGQGKVSVAQRVGVTASNNRAVPIEITNETSYIKETSVIDNDNGNRTRYERTPDTVTTGFQMQVFPRVMNNREIMVQFSLKLSELVEMVTYGDAEEAIQLPNISTTAFDQQAILKNGQTLILSGFERVRTDVASDGIGRSSNLVGGRRKANFEKVSTVLLITPRLISRDTPIGSRN